MKQTYESAEAMAGGAEDGFPVGECEPCGRSVLAHLWIDDNGVESHRCVHCDGVLTARRWIDTAELGDLGYAVLQGGCGRPGCGSGGCGRR